MSTAGQKRIAVVGAGAIGSLVGGILAAQGEQVTLIGNAAHMKAITEHGLRIGGLLGNFRVRVDTAESLCFYPDMVFLASKSQDVEAISRSIKPWIKDIPLITMQNGVRSAKIAGWVLERADIIICILLLNASFVKPGCVTCISQKPIVLGSTHLNSGAQLKSIQALLNKVAKTHISHDIVGAQWTKLLINAFGNSLDAMTGLSLGEYVNCYGLRRIGVLILKEALDVIEHTGITLGRLPGFPLPLFKALIRLPTPWAAYLIKYAMNAKKDSGIVTSTLQSLRKGKKTEMDYLNGEFVTLGKRIGRATPYNTNVLELVREIERSRRFYSPEEVIERFLF